MPDEETQIEPLHFEQHVVHLVRAWPQRTMFTNEFLQYPYTRGATVDGDLVTFALFNGEAVYRLTGELGPQGEQVAELVPDSDKVTSRRVERG